MLSSTLNSIRTILSQLQLLSDQQIDQLCELLSHYRYDRWLYPGIVKRKLQISPPTTYKVLDELAKNGYLKMYYELCCGNCQHTTGETFETLGSLPEVFECEMCHEKMLSIENAFLIYKVIQE